MEISELFPNRCSHVQETPESCTVSGQAEQSWPKQSSSTASYLLCLSCRRVCALPPAAELALLAKQTMLKVAGPEGVGNIPYTPQPLG